MKFLYHVELWFEKSNTKSYHTIESNNEVLSMYEIRVEINQQTLADLGNFNVINLNKTINN